MRQNKQVTILVCGSFDSGSATVTDCVASRLKVTGVPLGRPTAVHEDEASMLHKLDELRRQGMSIRIEHKQLARLSEPDADLSVIATDKLNGLIEEVDAWRGTVGRHGWLSEPCHSPAALEKIESMKLDAERWQKAQREDLFKLRPPEDPARLSADQRQRLSALNQFLVDGTRALVDLKDARELCEQRDAFNDPSGEAQKLDQKRYLELLEKYFGEAYDDKHEPKWKDLVKKGPWHIRMHRDGKLHIRNTSFGVEPSLAAVPQSGNTLFIVPHEGASEKTDD